MSDFEAEGTQPIEDNPPGISGDNAMEESFPPSDVPLGSLEFGVTAREELLDEPLAERVRREVPDRPGAGAAEEHVGRLVQPDEGMIDVDDEPAEVASMTADDAGLTAEEAAMHITDSP